LTKPEKCAIIICSKVEKGGFGLNKPNTTKKTIKEQKNAHLKGKERKLSSRSCL
jgi:hypothetical protein